MFFAFSSLFSRQVADTARQQSATDCTEIQLRRQADSSRTPQIAAFATPARLRFSRNGQRYRQMKVIEISRYLHSRTPSSICPASRHAGRDLYAATSGHEISISADFLSRRDTAAASIRRRVAFRRSESHWPSKRFPQPRRGSAAQPVE